MPSSRPRRARLGRAQRNGARALSGRTARPFLVSPTIRVSAMPSLSDASWLAAASGRNGSTASVRGTGAGGAARGHHCRAAAATATTATAAASHAGFRQGGIGSAATSSSELTAAWAPLAGVLSRLPPRSGSRGRARWRCSGSGPAAPRAAVAGAKSLVEIVLLDDQLRPNGAHQGLLVEQNAGAL